MPGMLDRHPVFKQRMLMESLLYAARNQEPAAIDMVNAALRDGPGIKPEDFGVTPCRISEVAKWAFAQIDLQDDFDKSFPVVAPVWNTTWFEYAMDKDIAINIRGKHTRMPYWDHIISIGVVMGVTEIPPEDRERAVREDWSWKWAQSLYEMNERKFPGINSPERIIALRDARPAKWLMSSFVFIETPGLHPRELFGTSHYIDEDGRLLPERTTLLLVDDEAIRSTMPAYAKDGNLAALTVFLVPAFYALGLLNCKNVEAVEMVYPRFVIDGQIKKKKPPYVTYRKLNIFMPHTKRIYASSEGRTGDKRALHLVRGHWANHTKHGLFGRPEMRGWFFVPQTYRGSIDEGEVRKTYEARTTRGRRHRKEA